MSGQILGPTQSPGTGQKLKLKSKAKAAIGQFMSQAVRTTMRQYQQQALESGLLEVRTAPQEHISLDALLSRPPETIDQRTLNEDSPTHRASAIDSVGATERQEHFENGLHRTKTLEEYLRMEFAPDLDDRERAIFDTIFTELDSRTGLLKAPPQQICQDNDLGIKDVESVLAKLRQCEPKGIGCESRKHYRLFLLREDGQGDSNEAKILLTQIANPTKRDADLGELLASEMEEAEFDDALAAVNEMPSCPWGGQRSEGLTLAGIVNDSPDLTLPDIHFVKVDGVWVARLQTDTNAGVFLSETVEQMIAPLRAATGSKKKNQSDDTRNVDAIIEGLALLEKHLHKDAGGKTSRDLLKLIQDEKGRQVARRAGITEKRRLADYAAKEQADFFESRGDWARLRPIGRKRVAATLHIHPSRVSSHQRNCWVSIEGLRQPIPFKALLDGSEADTGGIPSAFEESDAKEKEARELINRIINAETSAHRITDDILFVMLRGCGHNVTRQWVASRRAGLGHPDIAYGETSDTTVLPRQQTSRREWTLPEAEAFLKRLSAKLDKKRMQSALNRIAGGQTEYNPFAANTLLREIEAVWKNTVGRKRPLSAQHYAVMLNALGISLSRKWVEGAMRAKRDGRRKRDEDLIQFPVMVLPKGRAGDWSAQELGALLEKSGHQVDAASVEAAYEKIILQERAVSAERARQKRAAAKTHARA